MRDTNRGRVYTAEQGVRGTLKRGRKGASSPHADTVFTTVGDAQQWLDHELRPNHETKSQRKELPIVVFEKPKVKREDKSTSTYYACPSRHQPLAPAIGLYPGWGFQGLIVSHEYAHHLMRLIGDANNVVRACPSHGSEFARTFLTVVRQSHGDAVAALLEAAYDKHRVLYDPAMQRDAARKQILRLRSDITKDTPKHEVIPVTICIYAEDPDDFVGTTYKHTYQPLTIASTRTDELRFERDANTKPGVAWNQLRYFEAPMVRWR